MVNANMKSQLAALFKAWGDAEPITGFSHLPDGTYAGKIVTAGVGMTKGGKGKEPIPVLTFELAVVDGPQKGKKEYKRVYLAPTEKKTAHEIAGRIKGDLNLVGVKEVPEDLDMDSLGEILGTIAGKSVVFKVASKDEWTNIDFVDRKAAGAETDDTAVDEEPEADDTEAEEETAEPEYTAKAVKAMKRPALVKLAKEIGLDPKEYKKDADLAAAIIDALGL